MTLIPVCVLVWSGMLLAPPGDVSVFLGDPRSAGEVQVYDEDSLELVSAPPELRALRLLPLELAGRTPLEAVDAHRARVLGDLPGARRLLLPCGAGSLYHYRRTASPGTERFGLLLVGA